MSQNLFSVAKVQTFCDTITHSTEERRGETVKIVELSLRVQPFDAKLATALDDGTKADAGIRSLLFSLSTGDPKPHVRKVDVALGVPRQQMLIYASPDTVNESIALDQVKISSTYARTQKDISGYAFCFRASFGPLGKTELEFIQSWHLTNRFITFREAEKSLNFGDSDAPATDTDEKARKNLRAGKGPAAPDVQPEWDDDGSSGSGQPATEAPVVAPEPVGAREHGARRKMVSHQTKGSKGVRRGASK